MTAAFWGSLGALLFMALAFVVSYFHGRSQSHTIGKLEAERDELKETIEGLKKALRLARRPAFDDFDRWRVFDHERDAG